MNYKTFNNCTVLDVDKCRGKVLLVSLSECVECMCVCVYAGVCVAG